MITAKELIAIASKDYSNIKKIAESGDIIYDLENIER